MSDILVKKYQHYLNESIKLQETVNEQLAYITELEDAIIALDEVYRMTPARDEILKREKNKAQKDIDDSMERAYELSNEEEMTADEERQAAAAFARTHRISLLRMKTKPKEERGFAGHPDLNSSPEEQYDHKKQLSDSSLNKDLNVKRHIEKINKKTVKEETLSEISNELRINYLKAVEKKVADGKNWFGGKPEGRFGRLDATPGDAEARRRAAGVARALRQIGNINNAVQEEAVLEATKADDEHGTVARVGRITKFLEKHTDVNKMKAHHFNTFFDHPDYFGETDEASDKAMKKLPVHHRKQIRAMRKDYDDLNW